MLHCPNDSIRGKPVVLILFGQGDMQSEFVIYFIIVLLY